MVDCCWSVRTRSYAKIFNSLKAEQVAYSILWLWVRMLDTFKRNLKLIFEILGTRMLSVYTKVGQAGKCGVLPKLTLRRFLCTRLSC